MSSPRRAGSGYTLVEVLVAVAIIPLLMIVVWSFVRVLHNSQLVTRGRIEPRQNVRNALDRFGLAARSGSFFFTRPTSAPIVLGGLSCRLPVRDASGTILPGDTALVAVPVDLGRPYEPSANPLNVARPPLINYSWPPDGFCDNRYFIAALTTRPMTSADYKEDRGVRLQNGEVRQIVTMRWDGPGGRGIQPSVNFSPGSIDITALGPPSYRADYDTFLRPLNTTDPVRGGFSVAYGLRGGTPASADIHTEFEYAPIEGLPQRESRDFTLITRNLF